VIKLFKSIKNPRLREVLDWTFHIGIAVIIGLIIVNFVVQRTIVDGESMLPTLKNHDNLLVEKISPKLGKFHYGDIVTIDVPMEIRKLYNREKNPIIKRIIAVEGESVEIKDGKVLVNGKKIEENYINGDFTEITGNPELSNIKKLLPGQIYVMGDNRGNSTDSRIIGPIKKEWVTGKAVLRVLPIKSFGFVK
jgi:signal peptidase I